MGEEHDPLCPLDRNDLDANLCPYCPVIVKVRADERERIAQAIEQTMPWVPQHIAAQIARGGPE